MNARLLVCLAVILPMCAIRFATGDQLFEGDECKMEDDSEGECVKMPECPMRIREVQMGIRRATEAGRCNFEGFIEIVCCPKEKKLQPPIPSVSITQQPPATIISSFATNPMDIVKLWPTTETTTVSNRAPGLAINYTTVNPMISQNFEKEDAIISQTISPALEITSAVNTIPEMIEISSTTDTGNINNDRTGDQFTETDGPSSEKIIIPAVEISSPLMEILTSTVKNRITESALTKNTTESTNIDGDTVGPIRPDEKEIVQSNEVLGETKFLLIEKATTVESPVFDTMGPLIDILTSTVVNKIPETTDSSSINDNGIGVRPSQAACNEYKKGFLGRDGKTILVGKPILQSGEFPFMAALGYKANEDNSKLVKYKCGGTLISLKHVLTAAHCVKNVDNSEPVEVRVGNVNLQSIHSSVQIIPIGDITVHPRYKIGLNYNNIAIITLSLPVNVSQQVMPICLQYTFIPNLSYSINIARVITGWGMAREDYNDLPENLNLRLIEEPKCNGFYKNHTSLAQGVDDSFICVQNENILRRTKSCQNNTRGVPLVQVNRDSINVIGVELMNQDCGSNLPGVYTNTFKYIDWIESIVWPDEDFSSTTMMYAPIDIQNS